MGIQLFDFAQVPQFSKEQQIFTNHENTDNKEHEETIRIEHNEAEYLRKNGVYVSMTNRGKKSRSK